MTKLPRAGRTPVTGLARPARLALLLLLCAWSLFPFYWAFMLSLKQPLDFFNGSAVPFLSFQPTLESWKDEILYFFDEYGRLTVGRSLVNSTLVGLGSAALALAFGTPAGYALAA